MKVSISSDIVASLLQSPPKAAGHKKACAAERSLQLRQLALRAFAHWGHLRSVELARILWPDARYPDQLSQRLITRLLRDGLILTRPNAVGTRSFVLTRPGAAHLEALGLDSRHGLDLASVSGATFIHRSIATRYGIERQLVGGESLGEHALSSGTARISREQLSKGLGKLPDLVVIQNSQLDWVEVESAAKSKGELQRCLTLAKYCGSYFPKTGIQLNRIVFVCDGRVNHEGRILKAARDLWPNLSAQNKATLATQVKIVKVNLGACSKWLSFTEPNGIDL